MNLPLSGRLSRASSLVAFCSLLLLSGCMSSSETGSTRTAQPATAASPIANNATPTSSGKAATPAPTPAITSAKSATADSGSVIVKSTRANLRKEASASSAVIEEIPQGSYLALIDKKPAGPWYKVKDGRTGAEGWIHGNGITLPNEPAIIYKVESKPTPKAVATKSLNTSSPLSVPPDTSGRYYTNVDGKKVHSPVFTKTAPAGASARCRDGSYSFSQNRRGTCSHHGGVAEWL